MVLERKFKTLGKRKEISKMIVLRKLYSEKKDDRKDDNKESSKLEKVGKISGSVLAGGGVGIASDHLIDKRMKDAGIYEKIHKKIHDEYDSDYHKEWKRTIESDKKIEEKYIKLARKLSNISAGPFGDEEERKLYEYKHRNDRRLSEALYRLRMKENELFDKNMAKIKKRYEQRLGLARGGVFIGRKAAAGALGIGAGLGTYHLLNLRNKKKKGEEE